MRIFLKHILMLFCVVLAKVFFLQQRPSILMYHSFDTFDWKYGTHPEQLVKQLQFLQKKHNIVTLNEMVDYVKGIIVLPKNSVAITVDDGYEDSYEIFYKYAKKNKLPFTLFLTTDLSTKPNLGNLARPTQNMIKEMSRSGLVNVGLHGHTHQHFDKVLENGDWELEINYSSKLIESMTGTTPRIVAYPSGRYSSEVLDYFRSNKQYSAGVSIKSGFVTPGDNLFLLKRIEVDRNIQSHWLFKMRLTPALDVYNNIINYIK